MGARAERGDDDVVVAGGSGDVRRVRLTWQESATVVPLIAGSAARRQRDAAADAERRRAAGRNRRRCRDRDAVAARETDLPRSSAMRRGTENAERRLDGEIEDGDARQQRITER